MQCALSGQANRALVLPLSSGFLFVGFSNKTFFFGIPVHSGIDWGVIVKSNVWFLEQIIVYYVKIIYRNYHLGWEKKISLS